jgi:hypothetical protein
MDLNFYRRLSDAEKNRHQNKIHHREAMNLQRRYQKSEWIRWCVTAVIAVFGALNSVFGWVTIP